MRPFKPPSLAIPLRRAIPDSIKHHPLLRLLLVPEEITLVHRVLGEDINVPRVMIDVGAHVGSSLRPFAVDGWTVHAFEPDSRNRAELESLCRSFDSVTVVSSAVSDHSAERIPFYASDKSTGISGLSSFDPSHKKAGEVSLVTLDAYCVENGIREVGLLKIDVEGHDLFVLEGVPWDRLRPSVVVCEFDDGKTRAHDYCFHDLGRFLLAHGYAVLVSEWYPIKRYGGPHRWRRLERYPCELATDNAVGNLVGVARPEHATALEALASRLALPWRVSSALRQKVGV